MSEIIEKGKAVVDNIVLCRVDLNMTEADVAPLQALLDYAEQLEARFKGCQSCKYNKPDTPICEECIAEKDKRYYAKWKLAPLRRNHDA